MRSRRSFVSAVLAAALLVGQWLAVAHESQHALQPEAAHLSCAVCAHAHGAGAGALATTLPTLALHRETGAPEAILAASPFAASVRSHPIRGPPQLLC